MGHLVTSRLERYRGATEGWLQKHGIVFERLHMLDVPDAETRRRLRLHAKFKGEIYRRQREAVLFIESDLDQAAEIARISGKPALAFDVQKLLQPGFSLPALEARARTVTPRRVLRYAVRQLVSRRRRFSPL